MKERASIGSAYPSLGEIPAGKNPIVHLVDEARRKHGQSNLEDPARVIDVHVPAGVYSGFDSGFQGSASPNPEIDPWWGEATLRIIAAPERATLRPDKDWADQTITVSSKHTQQPNRIHLVNFDIHAGARCAIFVGAMSGNTRMEPIDFFKLSNSRILDRFPEPTGTIRPHKWGIFGYQACVNLDRVEFDMPHSHEHCEYLHGPCGDATWKHVRVLACGGQVNQRVSRPGENPDMGTSSLTIEKSHFTGFHRCAGRAGYAITQAGSGDHLSMRHSVVLDLDDPSDESLAPQERKNHGGWVTWPEVKGRELRSYPDADGFSNQSVRLDHCLFVIAEGSRSLASFDSVREVSLRGCGFFSTNGKGISVGTQGWGGVGRFRTSECNSDEVLRLSRAVPGVDPELLVPCNVVRGGKRRRRLGDLRDELDLRVVGR